MTTIQVKGRIGTRDVPKTVPVSVVKPIETSTLPVTGFNILFQVVLGGFAIAGGAMLFRRSSLA